MTEQLWTDKDIAHIVYRQSQVDKGGLHKLSVEALMRELRDDYEARLQAAHQRWEPVADGAIGQYTLIDNVLWWDDNFIALPPGLRLCRLVEEASE